MAFASSGSLGGVKIGSGSHLARMMVREARRLDQRPPGIDPHRFNHQRHSPRRNHTRFPRTLEEVGERAFPQLFNHNEKLVPYGFLMIMRGVFHHYDTYAAKN